MNNHHKQVHPTQTRPHSRIGDALGITLREHFAGLALEGLCVSAPELTPKQLASNAVAAADALCEELAK